MSGKRVKFLKKNFNNYFKRAPVGAIWGITGNVITSSEWRMYKKRYQESIKQVNAL